MRKTLFKTRNLLFLFVAILCSQTKSNAQCLQIESILVAACAPPISPTQTLEGYNEMVRFKIGNTNQNVSNLEVDWPSNNWQGLIQNSTTASKVTQLNASITAAGGCGQLIEPTGGVLLAGATVILITSYLFDVASNSFGALNDTYYVIFQNNSNVTTGHFANHNTAAGLRTLEIAFGNCSDSVTYDRTQLSNQIGAAVNFTNSGTASYVNNGCSAPIPPFTVDAGTNPPAACGNATFNLTAVAQGQTSVVWTAPSGTFSAANNLTTIYTPAAGATGNITLTITATNSCGATTTDTVVVTINSSVTPSFDVTPKIFCTGSSVPTLATTAPNGITGTWNPSTISNINSATYTFTPNAGQCAVPVSFDVTITNSIQPNFDVTPINICSGDVVPTLNSVSPNGITGTWSPAVISNTSNGTYTFTPNAGQCATSVNLVVNVTTSSVPDFDVTPLNYCSGATVLTLQTTSPNGVVGTWSPPAINNQQSGNYTFTPTNGQCASSITLSVTITESIVPDFNTTPITICTRGTIPTLNTISPNGVTGTWTPATIDNTTSGTYIFTADANQCAENVSLEVIISNGEFKLNEKCDNGDFIIFATSNDFNINDATITWTDATGNLIGNNDTELNVSEYVKTQNNVVYPFEITATVEINGCTYNQIQTISSVFCNIQKGISPNGDGKNDYFDLAGMSVTKITIFNRYGTEVYSKHNYTNEWKGQASNGNELPDGTYFYAIERVGVKSITGYIQINRQRN